MTDKKLYVEITSGEESYHFTKEEALKLLSDEFDRVEREKRFNKDGLSDEMGYEWGFEWLTDEEYAEFDQRTDKPRLNETEK